MREASPGKFHRWKQVFLFLVAVFAFQEAEALKEKICGSIDVRNHPKQAYQLVQDNHLDDSFNFKDCTIMDGSVSMTMITNESVVEEDFPHFPNLVEITGHVLVFGVRSLSTLSRIFPKLRVIGGGSLIMNYALVVYQNPDLKDISLPSLRVIRNGGVRIADNPSLCYVKHINWRAFLHGPIDDVIVQDGSVSGRRCEDECDVPATVSCHTTGRFTSCWNATSCQERCPFDRVGTNSTSGPGCVEKDDTVRCHDLCLSGCTAPNNPAACYACRSFLENGVCVPKCSSHLYAYGGRCVTENECTKMEKTGVVPGSKVRFKAINGKCDYNCPPGFKEDEETQSCTKCEGTCPRLCYGNRTIESIGQAIELRHCDVLQGYLSIEMRAATDKVLAEKLNEAFGSLQEIQGYLMVRFSSTFVSLHMFKNLKRITGKTLFKNLFSVVIFENEGLRQLFNPANKLVIERGAVQIHSNHMLCHRRIRDFMADVGKLDELKDEFQSPISNGDKAICDELTLEVSATNSFPNGFLLEWTAFNTSDMDHRKFLGYQIFYKKVTSIDPNMSIDDDRSTCSDTWKMHFEQEKETEDSTPLRRGALITANDIESDSIYAYYVQTRMVNHEGAKSAVSKVQFVRTIFGHPSPPRIRSVAPLGNGSVSLQWDAPLHPNGNVTYYHIRWSASRRDTTYAIKHVCDSHVNSEYSDGDDDVDKTRDEEDVSKAPSMSSFISSFAQPSQGTCSTIKGCCVCGTDYDEEESEDEETQMHKDNDFENAVQDFVFVQSCDVSYDPIRCESWKKAKEEEERKRKEEEERRKNATESTDDEREHTIHRRRTRRIHLRKEKKVKKEALDDTTRTRREIAAAVAEDKRIEEEGNSTLIDVDDSDTNPNSPEFATEHQEGYLLLQPQPNVTGGAVNVSDFKFLITGLRHFTEYQIAISACQDPLINGSFCSKDAYYNVRTQPIKSYDKVDPSTIAFVQPPNGTSDAFIRFEAPTESNGQILGFRVALKNQMQEATPVFKCVRADNFNGGVIFKGIADGSYLVEVRTITQAGESEPSLSSSRLHINNPGFFTITRLIIGGCILLILFGLAALLIWHCLKRYYGKRVGEYIRQTISANPEYLSQYDVYKADDWELARNKLTLENEIGRGTFGKVFKGFGHDVESKCGVRFGPCAIKTVSEDANPAERLHFLIEASVMKQFNTAFIIKLYGVVSDGQPVLVVMEMMEKGNLRDYLRSRRPDAEENTMHLPVPTSEQYFEWAAQIADGMAYLESLKFCHRDLAARNCMVGANDVVKIGDFGMARDIYYHEYYKPTGKRLMPVRWMAPESLKDGKFTMKSDVWSYGIVLYEMLTLAQQPYQGLGNDQVFNFIGVHRKILDRPTDCPDFWYDLMVVCWRYQPKDRPSFRQIVDVLAKFTSDYFQENSWVLNDGAILEDSNDGYVPEGHGMRMDTIVSENGGICIQNRKGSECNGWNGEGDAIAEHEM